MVKFVSPPLDELLFVSFLPQAIDDKCESKHAVDDSSDTFIGNLVNGSMLLSLPFVKCCDSSEVCKEFGVIEDTEFFDGSLSTLHELESNPQASVSSAEEDVSDVAVVHGVACGAGTKVGPLPLDG